MMRLSYSFALLIAVGFTLGSCSRVLSKRTDEQAWLEFDLEIRQNRNPASREEKFSPGLLLLRSQLLNVPVRSILLKCEQLAAPEVCYQSAITLQFDEIFRKLQNLEPTLQTRDYRKEQSDFLHARAYPLVRDEVKRFHESILSGMDLKAREHVRDLFRRCEDEKRLDKPIENFSAFVGTVTEMPKPVYACLSRSWERDEERLLSETADRLGLTIVTGEAKKWIQQEQIAPVYESEINRLTEKRSKEELARFQQEKGEVLKGFDPKLSQEVLLKEWAEKLRERYPYSPVEQWVLEAKTKRSSGPNGSADASP